MWRALLAFAFATAGWGGAVSGAPIDPLVVAASDNAPLVDHHNHLLSPSAAALLRGSDDLVPLKTPLPTEILQLLQKRVAAWNNAAALRPLYREDALALESAPVSGREAVSTFVAERFARPYEIEPLAISTDGHTASIAAMYFRSSGEVRQNIGFSFLSLVRAGAGPWQIQAETMRFPAPQPLVTADAESLIAQLDQAGIRRAVVMSTAYFFESPNLQVADGAAKLRADNDWTAAQIAKFPNRLVGFCGINPLSEQAFREIGRCKRELGFVGVKLHFGNSGVDLKKPNHLAKLEKLFAEADRLRMPIAAHLWNSRINYGKADAEVFLANLLPKAPHIVVQVMHMAGAGPGWTDDALEVLANAVYAKDPRTRRLYFDVATVADAQGPERLILLAKRIRKIGVNRILYGSDASFGGRQSADQEWGTFRGMVPLTDDEFAAIRANVAPYLR